MEQIGSVVTWCKAFSRQPFCWFGVILLLQIASQAITKYVFDGQPVTEILSWLWVTVSTVMAKPLVQLAMVPLAMWMFTLGVKRAIKESGEALARETEIRRKDAETIEKIEAFAIYQEQVIDMDNLHREVIDQMSKFYANLQKLEAGPVEDDNILRLVRSFPGEYLTKTDGARFSALEIPPFVYQWAAPAPRIDNGRVFDPAHEENQTWIRAQHENLKGGAEFLEKLNIAKRGVPELLHRRSREIRERVMHHAVAE